MRRLSSLLFAASICLCTSIGIALAEDRVEMKAYSTSGNDVLLLPATELATPAQLKILNNGAVVGPGTSIVLPGNKTLFIKDTMGPGMLLDQNGNVIGTGAQLRNKKIKVKTPNGRYVIRAY